MNIHPQYSSNQNIIMSAAKNHCDTCKCKSCVVRRHEEYMNSFIGPEIFVGGRYKLRSLEEFFDKENSTAPLRMVVSGRDDRYENKIWKFTKVIRAPLCITTNVYITFSVNGVFIDRIGNTSGSTRYLDMFEFDTITFGLRTDRTNVYFNDSTTATLGRVRPGYQYWYAPKDYDSDKPPLYYERVDESVSEEKDTSSEEKEASSPVDETKHEDDTVTEDIFDKILEGNKVVHKDDESEVKHLRQVNMYLLNMIMTLLARK